MQIYIFPKTITTENVYGYVEPTPPYKIYIREDMQGKEYKETLIHEYIHHLICKLNFFPWLWHMLWDFIDSVLSTGSFKYIPTYWSNYKEYLFYPKMQWAKNR